MELDDDLKKLMKDFGSVINDALSESPEISAAIQNFRDSGYDVVLVLEAIIGFNKRAENESANADENINLTQGNIKTKVSDQDRKFLKSLKIKVDDIDLP